MRYSLSLLHNPHSPYPPSAGRGFLIFVDEKRTFVDTGLTSNGKGCIFVGKKMVTIDGFNIRGYDTRYPYEKYNGELAGSTLKHHYRAIALELAGVNYFVVNRYYCWIDVVYSPYKVRLEYKKDCIEASVNGVSFKLPKVCELNVKCTKITDWEQLVDEIRTFVDK